MHHFGRLLIALLVSHLMTGPMVCHAQPAEPLVSSPLPDAMVSPAPAEPAAPLSPLGDTARLEAFIDGVVEPLMKNRGSPSGVVAIGHQDRLLFAKGYGWQDIAKQIPVDPASTLFRPGSTSKLFTWVSVMQLVEQGKLDLDTDVNVYLGDVRVKEAFGKPVTLRHIMTHTAGFEDGSLGYLIVEDPARILPLEEAMRRYQPERVNPPGTHTAYSNYATALAGLIVSRVSGLPFNDYVQQHIFDPLGMKNATFEEPLPPRLADQMATSYELENGAYVARPFEIVANFGPAGAESAAAEDMIRFGQAILFGGELHGQRILQQSTVAQMLTRNFSHDDRLMGMALGFYEDDYEGTRVVGHGGDLQYFHSFLGIDTEHELTVFVSFGAAGGSEVRSTVVSALYQEYFPRREARPVPPADFAARSARYTGSYAFWRNSFTKIEKTLGLANAVTVSATPENELVVGFAGKAKRYAEVEKNLFRETDSLVTLSPGINPRLLAFQEDETGTINGFVMDGLPFMSLYRLPFYAVPGFNYALLGVCYLVFLGSLARRFYQRSQFRLLPAAERSASGALVTVAALNWLVLIAGVTVISVIKDSLFMEIPLLFKAWLVLPILTTAATLPVLLGTWRVWRLGLFTGAAARLRYSAVAACAVAMVWFYAFWNILGFRYLA